MTKEQFDLKYRGEKVAVHCNTEEKAKAFLSLAKRFRCKWVDIYKDEVEITYWDSNGKETCYTIDEYDDVKTSYIDWYKRNGYKIVEFELDEPNGYAIEDTPSPMKFKVGDVVYAKKNGVELKVTETDLYRLETKDGTAWFMKKELLTYARPLKKITEKELAEMGYVLVK